MDEAARYSRLAQLTRRVQQRLIEAGSVAAEGKMTPLDAAEIIRRLHDLSAHANRIAHEIAQANITTEES